MPGKTLICIAVVLLLLISGASTAGQTKGLTVNLPTAKTIQMQQKVEELYVAGKFKRAFFLYRHELAPMGDKYAQYMVGFMYHTGTGEEENYPLAYAWYRLAAEQGTREFVAVREQLASDLTPEQHAQAELYYTDLRLEFSDLAVLLAAVKRDHEEMDKKTGSRFGSGSSPILVVEGLGRSGSDYYGRMRDRLEERLKLIKKIGDFSDLSTNPDTVNIHELERRVLERLQVEE